MRIRKPTGFRFPSRPLPGLLLLAMFVFGADSLAAEEGAAEPAASPWRIAAWTVQTSLYTRHFDPDPDHNNDQNLIGVEAVFENDWLAGAAVFDNSFGQPSQLVFVGKTWPVLRSEHWYFKLIGGLLHGYKEPYENKIPFNGLGVAPAIVPALGFRYRKVFMEANLGGLAVVTFTAGVRF
jgi:hypothetical protein